MGADFQGGAAVSAVCDTRVATSSMQTTPHARTVETTMPLSFALPHSHALVAQGSARSSAVDIPSISSAGISFCHEMGYGSQ
jgi:hypothetical protein